MNVKLNKEQQDAVNFYTGIASVIAACGSGKTLTMAERIGSLVKNHGVAPENILGLTFTKNAAESMRERLVSVLDDLSSRITLSTIHSFCHFLLRNEGRSFNILAGKDQIIFMREIMKKLKISDLSVGMVLSEISLAKNNLIFVDEFRDLYQGDKTMTKVADVYEEYDRQQEQKYLLDFDNLLVEVYRLLKENNKVREKYTGKFLHLLVDEYQDTNPVQMEILKILGNNPATNTSFWVCGDDWQSIYAFTGATVSHIINFNEMFPDSVQYILNLNYRSTPQILKACQNLIAHNLRKIDKELKTDNPDGDDIIVLEASSEETEALGLVNEIIELVESVGYSYDDIAVLYRCNFQSRIIEEIFSQHKIPYHIQNGLCFYDRREVKLLIDYLRVISEPDSDKGDESLKAIINVPNRYLGRKFIQQLEQFASDKSMYLYPALKCLKVKLPYIRKNIKEFVSFLNPLIEDSESLEPAEAIDLLRLSFDYDRYITEDDIPSPDDQKIQNINQLQLAASRYSSIDKFVEYAESFQDESVSDNKDGVNLMTIHRSKGLEFPAVFVVGLVEGIMPTKRNDNIEEERRVVFVACSRAMHLLYLSHSLTYLGVNAQKSRFLDEILGTRKP